MKHVFKQRARARYVPDAIATRKDKMGFPVPLQRVDARRARRATSSRDVFSSRRAREPRRSSTTARCSPGSTREPRFGRKIWGLLCLELWQQRVPRPRAAVQATADDERRHSHEGPDHRRRRASSARTSPTGCSRAATRSSSSTTSPPAGATTCAEHDGLTRRRGHDRRRRRSSTRRSTSFEPDVVVHAAASYKDPDAWAEDARTNALGTANVVQASRGAPASSGSSTSRPRSATACTRWSSRSRSTTRSGPRTRATRSPRPRASSTSRLGGLDWVSFRLANAYGPRNLSGPLPTFFQRLTEGKPCFVMDTRRDFIYVDDLVDVRHEGASTARASGAYHVSSGSDFSIKELFDATVEALEHRARRATSRCGRATRTTRSRSCSTRRRPSRTSAGSRRRRSRRASPRRSTYYREHGIEETFTHLKRRAEQRAVE